MICARCIDEVMELKELTDKTLEMFECKNTNELKEKIITNLCDHRVYRKGNASATALHNKAKKIVYKHKVETGELSQFGFDEWFGDSDE